MSDMATGKDADFSEERLIERYNTDLANSLGNLLNRTLNMAQISRQKIERSKNVKCILRRVRSPCFADVRLIESLML